MKVQNLKLILLSLKIVPQQKDKEFLGIKLASVFNDLQGKSDLTRLKTGHYSKPWPWSSFTARPMGFR